MPEYVSYRVYKDRFIPDEKLKNWQHINTIGYSWGFNKEQEEYDYKTGKELFEIYEKVKSLGGNLLLNIGPNGEGIIPKYELKALKELVGLICN
uniref:alpha-L-fucosidase n=1 Tax=viral metagenome TaxID=1070528 RepID=A0A6C0AFA0_9ZZZZ